MRAVCRAKQKYSTQARANVTGTAGNDGSVNAADEAAYASMVSTELSDVEVRGAAVVWVHMVV